MLVHERKIYPSTDGYFVASPQMYFITPSLVQTNSKWYYLDERSIDRHQQHQQAPCTIVPSTSGAVREEIHPKSTQNHSDGCKGVRDSDNSHIHHGDYPVSHHTVRQRRFPKDPMEVYLSPNNPQSLPSQTKGITDKSRSTFGHTYKTETLTKHRGGDSGEATGRAETEKKASGWSGTSGRKFGFRLFRLSFKKDKAKQLATFSAQFPPEEWPLRDEEVLNQLPHHVEMEIIRRINPDLTVENLARHTAFMKHLEKEQADKSKAVSATQSCRSRKSGERHRKPSQKKFTRSHSKTRAHHGDTKEASNLQQADRNCRAYSSTLARSPSEHVLASDGQQNRLHLAHSNPNILDSSHLPVTPEWDVSGELAKRRTEMPFPEPSRDPSAYPSKDHRSQLHSQERKSRKERSGKAKERSRSVENSKGLHKTGGRAMAYYGDWSHYYTDDATLRASKSSSYYSLPKRAVAKLARDLDGGRGLKTNKSQDNLSAYLPKQPPTHVPLDDYFLCPGSSDVVGTTTNPVETLGRRSSNNRSIGVHKERQRDRPVPHPTEMKKDKSLRPKRDKRPSVPLTIPDLSLPNGRPPQSTPFGHETREEIFDEDTLFAPPCSLPLPTNGSLRSNSALASTPLSSSCDALDSHDAFDAPKPLVFTPTTHPVAIEPVTTPASFDYYNVSDDDELKEGGSKSRGEDEKAGAGIVGRGEGGAGTMQWLLEREKERDLQRRFERTLMFPAGKATLSESSPNQPSAHAVRLDSIDSSSITVDSGFNSPRTRESLASNTSSIVENHRRQNLALNPGHGSISVNISVNKDPPLPFHTITEPASTQPEKTQKLNDCVASITRV